MRLPFQPVQTMLAGLLLILLLTPISDPRAQAIEALEDSEEPLEINADDGIEWQRDNKVYIARGNARAAQGDIELFADTLTAHYRESEDGKTKIYQVDANGNVRIVSPKEEAFGDDAVYLVDTGHFTLTGEDLRLLTEQDTLTARDSLEYFEKDRIAVAKGNAVSVREDKRIRADVLIARFIQGEDGKLAIEQVDAEGQVQISTPKEFASGNKARYYVNREFATLTGDAKVTSEENQLNGEYAEVDLKTGISKMLGAAPNTDGDPRVRAILVPDRKPDQSEE